MPYQGHVRQDGHGSWRPALNAEGRGTMPLADSLELVRIPVAIGTGAASPPVAAGSAGRASRGFSGGCPMGNQVRSRLRSFAGDPGMLILFAVSQIRRRIDSCWGRRSMAGRLFGRSRLFDRRDGAAMGPSWSKSKHSPMLHLPICETSCVQRYGRASSRAAQTAQHRGQRRGGRALGHAFTASRTDSDCRSLQGYGEASVT